MARRWNLFKWFRLFANLFRSGRKRSAEKMLRFTVHSPHHKRTKGRNKEPIKKLLQICRYNRMGDYSNNRHKLRRKLSKQLKARKIVSSPLVKKPIAGMLLRRKERRRRKGVTATNKLLDNVKNNLGTKAPTFKQPALFSKRAVEARKHTRHNMMPIPKTIQISPIQRCIETKQRQQQQLFPQKRMNYIPQMGKARARFAPKPITAHNMLPNAYRRTNTCPQIRI